MYCVNCGVKLGEGEKACPLCKTPAVYPERAGEKRLYPEVKPSEVRPSKGGQVLLTILFLIPAVLVWLCDWQIHDAITWSGYVLGGLVLGYVVMVLPLWFQKANPVIFVPCDFAAAAVLLLYIDLTTAGGWFLPFAFPVTGGLCLIVTALVTLLRYVKRGRLYIIGGCVMALGAFMLLVEFLMFITFHFTRYLWWSVYPLVVLVALGGFLIYLAISPAAREMMERKFFI